MIYEFNGYKPVIHPSSFIHPQACVTGNVIIGKDVYVGPGAAIRGDWGPIIHGGTIGKNVLVGMNAVVMDNVEIGDNCVIGALTFVPANTKIEERKVLVGNPAKVVKDVTDEMITWKTEGTKLYQQLPAQLHATLKPCEPLAEPEPNRPQQQAIYKTWKE